MGRTKKKPVGGKLRTKAAECVAVAALLVLFCSCLSFDIGDWPSSFVYPHNSPSANWCGAAGALFAYYLLYFIGPGVFVALVCGLWFLAVRFVGGRISQPVLRSIGLGLVTTAASSTFYIFWPHSVYGFPMGSGGVLGVASAELMRRYFASLGTGILLASVWAVGLSLLADSVVAAVVRWVLFGFRKGLGVFVPGFSAARQRSRALGRIWRRLSARRGGPLAVSPAAAEHEQQDAAQKPSDRSGETISGMPLEVRLQKSKLAKSNKAYEQPSYDDYTLPPLDLLDEAEHGFASVQERVVKAKAGALERLLSEFNINARVVAAETGPVVTMFELQLAAGVKVSQISSLSNDMARALGVGAVRVVAPLPGKHTIGVEVPNSEKEKVRMKDMLELAGARPGKMAIPLFLGKDSAGEALVSDLTKMPHLLIAGTTGSGKSVCINAIILSLLMTKRPDHVKMILIDPKMVELSQFKGVPHLMCPIVTDLVRAERILEWAVTTMDERYELLAEARVKNISEYNELGADEVYVRLEPATDEERARISTRLPHIVIIIDELADLMMTAAKEVEHHLSRLAQKSRAVGVHIIVATQRPEVKVVTGLIKSNLPCRICFRVASRMDSRIVLDHNGGEVLMGAGDMLFLPPGVHKLIRAQGTFLEGSEIHAVLHDLGSRAKPEFHPELVRIKTPGGVDGGESRDPLFDEAVRIILESKRGSVSLLQRRLNVGYSRASRLIDQMAQAGIVGDHKGSQAREVAMTLDEWEALRAQVAADRNAGYAADKDDETIAAGHGKPAL